MAAMRGSAPGRRCCEMRNSRRSEPGFARPAGDPTTWAASTSTYLVDAAHPHTDLRRSRRNTAGGPSRAPGRPTNPPSSPPFPRAAGCLALRGSTSHPHDLGQTARMPSEPLQRYRAKRDFKKTREPSGAKKAKRRKREPIFVIQEHAARSLHYDFRLEVDGVLKSWAVPKGPSTDPREKRLAVEVEDHPLDYGDFEGTIGEGQYGAGAVIVWDTGPYRNEADVPMDEALDRGHVNVFLEGSKLEGGWVLQRTRKLGNQQQWLLIKRKDEFADARRNPVSTQPESVLSGKTVKEIA